MNQLPTCLDINAECDNEPCMFHHDHKCTFHCRQWRHVNTGYQNQSERDTVLDEIDCILTGYESYKHISGNIIFPVDPTVTISILKKDLEKIRTPAGR